MTAATATRASRTPAAVEPAVPAVSKGAAKCGAFGFEVGKSDRVTLEQSEPLHNAYVKLDEAKQGEWRTQFITQYLIGSMNLKPAFAAEVFAAPRTKREPAQQLAVLRGAEKFRTHIARNGHGGGAGAASVEVTDEWRDAIVTAVESVYEKCDADSVGEMIKYLQAYKKTLKA